MGRVVGSAVLFLFLGVVLNITAAWAYARFHKLDRSKNETKFRIDALDDDRWPPGSMVYRYRGFGGERFVLTMTQRLPALKSSRNADAIKVEDFVPSRGQEFMLQATTVEVGMTAGSILAHIRVLDSMGWPLPSLWGGAWYDVTSPTMSQLLPDHYPTRYAVALQSIATVPGKHGLIRLLPLMPIWPNFAINTLFYAAILWVVWATRGAIRRRGRRTRGLCLACGYDLRGIDSLNCPECGIPRVTELHSRSTDLLRHAAKRC